MNFNDILDTPVNDIERPPLPPFGTYKFIVTKWAMRDFSGKDGTEYQAIEFVARGLEAGPDVDMEALREYGDPKNIIQTVSFMGNKADATAMQNAAFKVRRFLEETLKLDTEGKSLKQALPLAVNAAFMGNVQYEPDRNDPNVMYARLKAYTAVE